MGRSRASLGICLLLFPLLWTFARGTVEISAVGVPAVNGSSVVLTCTLSSNASADTATYAWYRAEDTNEDVASASGSGQSGGNIQDTMPITRGQNFTFSSVTFSDQGFYVCGATFDGFVEELSDPYTLYVSPEGSVSVSANPSMSLYSEGDEIEFSCLAQGGPFNEYEWRLNDDIILNQTEPSLGLVNITGSEDGGVYTCIASNEAGGDEDSFTVNVSPVITLNPAPIDVDVPVIAMLECAASGFPEPTYQWFKVGGEISANVTGEDTSILTFNKTYYGDEGDYFCQATSGNITVNSSVATLTLSPSGTVAISPVNGSFSVGEDVNLMCSARGGPGNVFQWSKNGTDLEGENSTVLALTNLTLEDGGEYGCGVKNSANFFNATTFVFINPVITEHPSDVATTNGTSVRFRCSAEAFPDPTYQWTYSNGSEIISDLISGVNTATLEFLSAEFGAEGTYVCTATANDFTAASDEATLFLSPAETVTISPSDVTVDTGDNVTLTCSALGGPNNTFSWQREGVSINVTEDTLVISSITTSEGGDHTCIVSNTAGQGSDIVTVFIRPIITSAEDILTTNGTDIEFVCEADGIPSPNVTWERVGEAGNTTVSENTNFALSPAVFGSEGDYQCVAISTAGRATQTATLTISPEGSVVASPRDVSSERGLEQTFTCDASGGPGNTFLWTRLLDSVVVSRTSQLNVVVNNSYNGGEYRCTVQNDAGNDTDTVVLRVAVSVDLHPESGNVSIADNFTLICAASAYPLPNITWWHNFTLVDETDPRITISQTTGDRTVRSSITTINATTSDGGTYVCQVGTPPGTGFNTTDSDPALILVQATPERPQDVRGVNITSQSLVLQWVEPHDSNAPIMGYRVMYSQPDFEEGGANVVLNTSDTSLLVASLLPGITYNFTVVAFNEIGNSPPSDVASVRTLDEAPTGFPQNVAVARTTSTVIELEWDPVPVDQRNGEITNYEVELNQFVISQEPQSEIRATPGPQLSINLTGLQEFVEYTVRVRANNSAGFGPFSTNLTTSTLTDRPDSPPQNVTATALSPTEIEVSWEEVPLIDQNGMITTYEVRYTPETRFQDEISTNSVNITNSSVMSITLTGLEEYVEYNISVRAYTSEGPGPYSPDVAERTYSAEPATAPRNVSVVVISSTDIEVSWEELRAIDENGEIIFYEVEFVPLMLFDGQIAANTTRTSLLNITLTALEEYVEYRVRVRAHTIAGAGPYSDPIIRRTLQAAPSAPPDDVTVESLSSTTIRVNWSEVPPIRQNGIILMYEIEYSQNNFTEGVPTLNQTIVDNQTFSLVLRDLLEYVVYSVSVRAYTEEGDGPYSDAVHVRTDQDVPASPPVDVSVTNQSATTILVTWSEVPAIDRNGIIISYDVEYTQDMFPSVPTVQSLTVNDTMATLTGLEEYVVYSVRVRASTIVGSGPYSENVTERTQEAAPASPPTNVNATAQSPTSILVTWEDVLTINQNGIITGYQVEYSQSTFGNTTQNITVGDVRSVLLIDLEEYVEYSIRVRASTTAGYGPYSEAIIERTLEDAPASPPVNVNVTATSSTSIRVSWDEVPLVEQNGVITVYEVEYNQSQFGVDATQTATVTSTAVELTRLLEYVVYSVRVRAYTDAGSGPYSNATVVRTLDDVPSSPPPNVLVVEVSPTTITVVWDLVVEIERNGIITEYEVEYNQSTFPGVNSTQTLTVTSTMAQLARLHEYVDYFIRVRAYTRVGPGPYSSDINNTTSQDIPSGAPRNLNVANSSANSLSVQWERPDEIDINGVLVQYAIDYFISNTSDVQTVTVDGDTLATELINLDNFTLYDVNVYAVTIRRGPPVSGSQRTSENVPGEAPLDVMGYNSSSTSIVVIWFPPPPDVIFGILRRFEIRYFISSQPQLKAYITNLTHTDRTFEIRGLEEFTNYSIEISAVTIGNGPFSAPIYVFTDEDIPGDVPQPPEVPLSDITTTTARISWNEPPDTNGIIISYTVNYMAVSMASGAGRRRRQAGGQILPECIIGGAQNINRTVEVPGSQQSLLLEDLTPFSTYEFSVRPETRIGRGDFSAPRSFETEEYVPMPPLELSVEYINSTSLQVTWNHPQCDYGIRTRYTLNYSALPSPIEPQGTLGTITPPYSGIDAEDTSIIIEELSPNTNYSIYLCASTRVGCGNFSTATNQTNEDAPLGVTNLMIRFTRIPESDTEVMLDITWTPPSNRNGSFQTLFTYSGSQTPDYPPQRSNSTSSPPLALPEETASYTIRDGLPYAKYTVTLQPFNIKTSNTAPADSMIARTIAIEPTVVLDLRAEGETSTSIRVVWDLPRYPNGPISSYFIYYRKVSDDTTDLDPSSVLQDPNNINIDGYSIKRVTGVNTTQAIISDLEVYRYYSIIVRAIGAEPGSPPELNGALLEVVERTFSDLPTEQPQPIQPDGNTLTTITITLPDHSYIDAGEVIFYAVVLVRGYQGNTKQDDYDDASAYDPITFAQYYITAAWANENVTRVPQRYVIGNESVTYANGVRYLNGRLESGSEYSFFVRIDLKSDTGEPLRIRTNFTNLSTRDEIDSNAAGAAAGGVIAILVAIAAACAIVFLIFFLLKRYRTQKLDIFTGELNDMASSMQPVTAISSRVIANPLATPHKGTFEPILVRNFATHAVHLHSNDDFLFAEEYASVDPNHIPASEVCLHPENQSKNRYANIKAYDHSRVKLAVIPEELGSDYINANRIDGYGQMNAFIATQGPVPATVADFWRMVWEQGTATIVMLTNLEEKGRVKCHKYWPDEMERTKALDSIHIYFQDSLVLAEYTVRTFSLQMEGFKEERIVKQFHYTVWPDHGVPDYPTPLLQFVRKVAASNPMNAGPIIVHCSAGVGRTGTFITLDAQLKRIKKEGTVDIFGFVRKMRGRRCYMVQTEQQYIFLHDALLEAIECGVTEVAARDLQKQLQLLLETDAATGKSGLQKILQKLQGTVHLRDPKTVSSLPVNLHKNRYADREMLPYDNSRCRLKSIPGAKGSDYINASYINGYYRAKEFIATQGPLPDTENDFWRMVWEQKSSTIVMLTKHKENNGKVKCHMYWPSSGAGQYDYLQVILIGTTPYPDYTLREFNIVDTRDESSRLVKHYQYTDWPENSVPETGSALIDLIGQVQRWQRSCDNKPIIVHCSGGCGRTGTYIAVSILIERLKTEGVVDVFQTVRKLRMQRPGMVASPDQYRFCYQTLIEFLDSFEMYANFK